MTPVSPIKPLCDHALHVFEQANPASERMIREAVAAGRIDAAIELDWTADTPKTPFVDGHPPSIRLHITYLEMLWAFTYGMFVSYEHEMRETMLHLDERPPDPAYSVDIRRRAASLLLWSKGLRQGFTPWPTQAPSPASFNTDEKDLVGKVNTLFSASVAVVLHHEFCHAMQRHLTPNATLDELLEQEKEADDFAHHQFIDASVTEQDKRIRGWSLLIPPLSCLYLVSGPSSLFQEKHPHVHHRIAHALSRLDFLDEKDQDYFNGLCLMTLITYMIEHDLLDANFRDDPTLKKAFDRVGDAFDYFSNQLDLLDEPFS